MSHLEAAKKVLIIGQGYVGLPLAMAACQAGYKVHGVDNDRSRVDLLLRGGSFTKDVTSSEIRTQIEAGSYTVSESYQEVESFDIAVITVPTPLRDGAPDIRFIEEAANQLATLISSDSLIVLESTTYPGTTQEVLIPLLEKVSGMQSGRDFLVGYSPERIDPGNSTWNLFNTPKIISGDGQKALEKTGAFYGSLGITTIPVSSTQVAELTKLLENTFRHVNIALVNELSVFAGALGVDIWEAIDAAETKPFGFMRFSPGPGVGGHCLPIDPSYLSWKIKQETGSPFRFVELANAVNALMPAHVVSRVNSLIGGEDLRGEEILIVGLAYKANTSDIRESPAIEIANQLNSKGAKVFAIDPLVPDEMWPFGIERLSKIDEANPSAVIVVTDHDDFDFDLLSQKFRLILDTRNRLRGPNVFSM